MVRKFTLTALVVFVSVLASGHNDKNQLNRHHPVYTENQHLTTPKSKNAALENTPFFSGKSVFNGRKTKSAAATKLKMDSILTYDFAFTRSGSWARADKAGFTYDVNGNTTQIVWYVWDEELSKWIGEDKSEYTYNNDENVTQHISYAWDTTSGSWVNFYKAQCSYGNYGYISQYIGYYWNAEDGWLPYTNSEYTHNTTGLLLLESHFYWDTDSGDWVGDFKTEYRYNSGGNISQETVFYWDSAEGKWETARNVDYTYDDNGNTIQVVSYAYDAAKSEWVEFWKFNYAYDVSGNMTQDREAKWDTISSQWVDICTNDYTFDEYNNLIREIYYEYEEDEWMAQGKGEFSYDNMFTYDDLILPAYFDESEDIYFNHKLDSSFLYFWDESTRDWIFTEKDVGYYSELLFTDVSDKIATNLKVYPNPVSDFLMVEIQGQAGACVFELYDITGSKLISNLIHDKWRINLGDLSDGLYVYKLKQNGKIRSGKLLKQ